MKSIKNIISIISVIYLLVVFIGLIISPFLPFEFVHTHTRNNFYWGFCVYGASITVLILMIFHYNYNLSLFFNWVKISVMVVFTYVAVIGALLINFLLNGPECTFEQVLFRRKDNPDICIVERAYIGGALSGKYVSCFQLQPFFYYWNHIEKVDISELDLDDWEKVSEMMN
jgi:hypothetical protein